MAARIGAAVFVAAAVGATMGAGSSLVLLNNLGSLGRESIHGWLYNRNAGSSAADPYDRAMIAKSGLLALTRGEAIYFQRSRDERGRPLDAACRYEVTGGSLPSRWWSLTIYADDDFLPVNGDDAEAMDATRTRRRPDGSWVVEVSAKHPPSPDWISSRNAGKFSLALRMYNPNPGAAEHPQSIPLPTLHTVSCQGAAA